MGLNQQKQREELKELDQNVLRGDSVGSGLDVCSTGGKWKRKDKKNHTFMVGKYQVLRESALTIGEKAQFSNRKKIRQL